MTIVNFLKIPIQIQFGLEKSLTIDNVDDNASYTSSSSAGGFINYFSKSYIITLPGGCIDLVALTKMTS